MIFLLVSSLCLLTGFYSQQMTVSEPDFTKQEFYGVNGRMLLVRPWLSAGSLWSKALARSLFYPPTHSLESVEERPRKPSDMNRQNTLLNLLRTNMKTISPLIKKAKFTPDEKQKKKF